MDVVLVNAQPGTLEGSAFDSAHIREDNGIYTTTFSSC
jgi:hypothetical protein